MSIGSGGVVAAKQSAALLFKATKTATRGLLRLAALEAVVAVVAVVGAAARKKGGER